jgi:hypothetical protein
VIRKLTYQQLFYLYLTGALIAFVVIFKIALKPTFELRRTCTEKQEILNTVADAPQQIKLISDRLTKLNSRLSSISTSGTTTRDKILEEISKYCQQAELTVYNYPPSHFFDNKTFVIETNRIVIKGNFKQLLQLLNYIETKGNFSRIVSLTFQSEENRKTKTREIFLELIFQNINDTRNETK